MPLTKEEYLLKDRIKHLLNKKGLKIAHIADTPTFEARLGRQINGEAQVPYTTLFKLLYMFDDIDANWLIMGHGGMFKENHNGLRVYNHNEVRDTRAGGNINVGNNDIPYPVQALLDEKDKRIAELEKTNATLQNILNAFAAGTKKG